MAYVVVFSLPREEVACYSRCVMIKCSLLLALITGFLVAVQPAAAQEVDTALPVSVKGDKKSREKALPAVAELLSRGRFLTRKKPNLKARYYGFLRSASWCVPCTMIVPKLLKDYGKMKGAKMELILLGQEDEAVVKKYMKEHDYNIPGAMPAALGDIPGLQYPGLGFPSLCIVDAEGNFVAASGGVNMYEWKKQIQTFKKEQQKLKQQEKREAGKLRAQEAEDA